MIQLKDKQQVIAPNVTYPFGNIKDDTGIGDGTPVNQQVYADFHQFFAKMFSESGLVANNLPDNETNGFQLFQSLLATRTNLAVNNETKINQILARLGGGDFSTF